jgi:hypothetical protein
VRSFFRFICRMPEQPRPSNNGMMIMGILPSLMDCIIQFIDEQGNEHEITCVNRVTFDSGERAGDVVTATLHLHGVEVELEQPAHAPHLAKNMGYIDGRPSIPAENQQAVIDALKQRIVELEDEALVRRVEEREEGRHAYEVFAD